MSGHMADLGFGAEDRKLFASFEPTIDFHRNDAQARNREAIHHFRRLDQDPVGGVGAHHGLRGGHDLGRPLRVVPVAVRQPKFREAASLGFQYRLNLLPNLSGSVDEDRRSVRWIGEQVRISLYGPRRQNMNLHAPILTCGWVHGK